MASAGAHPDLIPSSVPPHPGGQRPDEAAGRRAPEADAVQVKLLRRRALAAALVVAAAGPACAQGGEPARTTAADPGGPVIGSSDDTPLGVFDQLNTLGGSLRTTGGAVVARITGEGPNAYARGLYEVRAGAGRELWYGASFYLPRGFKQRMQGQVALLRWDDWVSHPRDTEHGGVVIYGGDRRARIVHERLTRIRQRELAPAFDLPEGRWFRLTVRQRLGTDGSALSVVYLNGRPIRRSTALNLSAGRQVERVRFGLVAIAGGAQRRPLELRFRGARVAGSRASWLRRR